MSTHAITPCDPSPNTLIAAAYADPDYRDAYLINGVQVDDVADFASHFFLSQPAWLRKVSMSIGSSERTVDAIGAGAYEEGSSVGSWKIHGRNDDEIMFGEHMGFMEYRFSMLRLPAGQIEVSTSVHHLRRFGHVYFALVKPFHVGFIKLALRNAAEFTDAAVVAT